MAFDRSGRRSRFVRTPRGKHIVLTERDRSVMRWLHRYRYLSAAHLHDIIQPRSAKRFSERLGDLFHETGLIDRPPAQWQLADIRWRPLIYELSPAGTRWLMREDSLPHRTVTFSRRRASGRMLQWQHTMMVIEAVLATERATASKPDERFVPVDEILARAPKKTQAARNPLSIPVTVLPEDGAPGITKPWHTHLIPDALYGVEYLIEGQKRYRFWALECDSTTPTWRSSVSHSSVARKQAAYRALQRSKAFKAHWRIPNLRLMEVRPPARPPPTLDDRPAPPPASGETV